MFKYVIQTQPGWYVKSGKDDTNNINKAKLFDSIDKANLFIQHMIGGIQTSFILSVEVIEAVPKQIKLIKEKAYVK
jgi:ATP-dependent phosphoenolpyruvate carboxykinase